MNDEEYKDIEDIQYKTGMIKQYISFMKKNKIKKLKIGDDFEIEFRR